VALREALPGRTILAMQSRVVGRALSLSVIVLAIAGCSGTPPATPTRSLGPGEGWVPVANWSVGGQTVLCAGGGFVQETVFTVPRPIRASSG
jgi:hypothetical protein